jgi:hypothetical protein
VGHRRNAAYAWFALGCALAVALLAGLAEGYLRLFPLTDLHPYLGEASPLTGIFVPDQDFGVAYRSWDAFRDDNAPRIDAYLPLGRNTGDRKVWAMFGNSFIQAPAMLADVTRVALPDHLVFNLGRNEHLCVRLAQVKLLLENGLRPERVFIELMPVDLLPLGDQPLATMRVTSKGALTYEPRLPTGWAGELVEHSQLGLTAWVRAGRHKGNPRFNKRTLYQGIDETLQGDLHTLFANLARYTHYYQVPVTILLIPSYHQVAQNAGFGFQDALTALLRPQGYDVFDPRDAFRRHPDPESLYLPDKHLTLAGNQLLLGQLLGHLAAQNMVAHSEPEARRP